MKLYFEQMAAYSRWANARLYAASIALLEEAYRRPIGLFFSSLHGVLNHGLATDRIWLRRLTGVGDAPDRLDAIVFDDRMALSRARLAEDIRLQDVVSAYDEADFCKPFSYVTLAGAPQEQRLADSLAHLFNHQTHHRGQAHTGLSLITGREPPPLDLLLFQRGVPAPDLRAIVGP